MIHADPVTDPSDTALIETPLLALHWHLNLFFYIFFFNFLKPIKEPVVSLYMKNTATYYYIHYNNWTSLNACHQSNLPWSDAPSAPSGYSFPFRFLTAVSKSSSVQHRKRNTREAWFNPRSRPRHLHTDLTIIIPHCFRVRSRELY